MRRAPRSWVHPHLQPHRTGLCHDPRRGARLVSGAVLLVLWALGVAALLGRLAIGAWIVRRIVRAAQPLEQPTGSGSGTRSPIGSTSSRRRASCRAIV
jgi:hypothetical protein